MSLPCSAEDLDWERERERERERQRQIEREREREKEHRLRSVSNLIQFPLLEISLHTLAHMTRGWWALILEAVVVRLVYTTGMPSAPTINSLLFVYLCFYHFQNKQDWQCSCNIETRSCNHCCSGKAISITYSECVFVALGIQHAMRLHNIVIYDLPGATEFSHIMSYTARL